MACDGMSLDRLPLVRSYPAVARRLPHVSIGDWPTPVTMAPALTGAWGTSPVWIKREDASASAAGGNKVRGLEFLIAAALARRATHLVTLGAMGSFHVRGTALHGRRHGLETTAILNRQPHAPYVDANLAVARSAGATLVESSLALLPLRVAWHWWRQGRDAYFIPPGGTCPLACIGHVNAAFELRDQVAAGTMPEPCRLFVPLGSLGTAAGLLLGCKLAGLRARVTGVTVFARWFCTRGRVARLARRTNHLLRQLDASIPDAQVCATDLDILNDALGRGYAHPTAESEAVAAEAARHAGLLLDPTYSAKLYAGAKAWMARAGDAMEPVLLWHTFAPANGVVQTATMDGMKSMA